MPIVFKVFSEQCRIIFSAKEKIINNFKGKIFPIKNLEKIPTPGPAHKSTPDPTVFHTSETTPDPTVFDRYT